MKTYPIKTGSMLILLAVFLFLFAGCGKQNSIKRNKAVPVNQEVSAFAESFFFECNYAGQKLSLKDVQNTADEFLFYIPDGVVYRTTGNYCILIAKRESIREPEDKKGTDYSGELYQIFDEDSIDILKYCAAGDYVLMAVPSTIPDWDDNDMIADFMEYAASYTPGSSS